MTTFSNIQQLAIYNQVYTTLRQITYRNYGKQERQLDLASAAHNLIFTPLSHLGNGYANYPQIVRQDSGTTINSQRILKVFKARDKKRIITNYMSEA